MATNTETEVETYDVVEGIMNFEAGEASEEEIIELFQHLVTSGTAWQLQGIYGRTAQYYIEAGLVTL